MKEYKRLMKIYHPDHNQEEDAYDQFYRVKEIALKLGDCQYRYFYDILGLEKREELEETLAHLLIWYLTWILLSSNLSNPKHGIFCILILMATEC